jgi:hypothetical protein
VTLLLACSFATVAAGSRELRNFVAGVMASTIGQISSRSICHVTPLMMNRKILPCSISVPIFLGSLPWQALPLPCSDREQRKLNLLAEGADIGLRQQQFGRTLPLGAQRTNTLPAAVAAFVRGSVEPQTRLLNHTVP